MSIIFCIFVKIKQLYENKRANFKYFEKKT